MFVVRCALCVARLWRSLVVARVGCCVVCCLYCRCLWFVCCVLRSGSCLNVLLLFVVCYVLLLVGVCVWCLCVCVFARLFGC